jgi:hypothetical protein
MAVNICWPRAVLLVVELELLEPVLVVELAAVLEDTFELELVEGVELVVEPDEELTELVVIYFSINLVVDLTLY